MRNAVAHGYFQVDYAIVWQTIASDLPNLRAQAQAAWAEITSAH
ncbi:HepT-like ribonuclease domain-containing protein [Comamonas badia]|nr:HepT-like ribonuclease domain-containing protein [Comamonas badia]